MLKKTLIILLVLAMLTTVFAGCKDDSQQTTGNNASSNDAAQADDRWKLPELNYEGATVTIHTRGDDETVKEIGKDDDGSALSSELYERTTATEERLDVEIVISKQNSWSQYSQTILELRDSISTGKQSYDLVAGWSPRTPVLASEDLFYDLNQFDYFDSDDEWWSQSLVEALTVNGKLYLATGDISTTYMDGAFATIFNQPLALSLGYNYSTFYEVVTAGEWTLDYLYELTKNVDQDNGNSTRDDQDVYTVCRCGFCCAELHGYDHRLGGRDGQCGGGLLRRNG